MFIKDKALQFIPQAAAEFLQLDKALALLKEGEEKSLLSRESRRFLEQHPPFVPEYTPARRSLACAMVVVLLTMFVYPRDPAVAQKFKKYDEASKKDVEQFMDRADRLSDRDAWTNYVELGIATERIQWEETGADELYKRGQEIDADSTLADADKKLKKDEAAALYEAARVQWETDALDHLYEERGAFTARKETVDSIQITEADYDKITASADAAVADIAQLDLTAYDAAVGQGRDPLVSQFDTTLAVKLNDARARNASLDPAEKAAFEAELSKREADIRNEFTVRDSFYIKRARNRYIAVKRADDVSARLAADKASADAVGDAAIQDTLDELQKSTSNALDSAQQAVQDTLSGPNASTVEDTWQKRMEALIEAGLHRWETAEEDLYSKRLAWTQETKSTRDEAEQIWKENHEKLKAARDKWLKEVQQQIIDGRQRWDQKALEFQQSREVAERELGKFVDQERQKWEASSQELSDMVKGGGSALLEAKDAYRYYADILATKGEPSAAECSAPATDDLKLRCFYKEQRDYMGAAIGRFQNVMTGSAGILKDVMHSPDDSTGLLNDKRLYIDPALVTQITGIGEGNYKQDMVSLVTGQKEEDFLLYQRDLLNLADRNSLFVTRAGELKTSADFQYSSAASIDDLRSMVLKMDVKYSDHKRELLALIEKDRTGLDDTQKLAAVKKEIDDWFGANTSENARLKREVSKYFTDGLGGYYLTGSDNDPYLMTQAEYEWELLRRERNYLAARLRKAEEVKRYADLAARHDAGLELAAVTEERQAVAKIRADLRELSYRVLKGDVPVNPAALTDTGVRDAEYLRILAEKGIDPAAVSGRESRLNDELSLLTSVASLTAPSRGTVSGLITSIDDYFTRTGTPRDGSALGPLYTKLTAYRDAIDRGEDPSVLADRWKVVAGAAGDVKGEMQNLLKEYDFTGLRGEFTALNVEVGQKTVVNYNDELRLISAQMDVTSRDLAAAQERLERAKTAYREARIDFDVIRLGNSEDLVRIDLLNTTQTLASVLNRMSVIENIPGFSGLTDQAGLRQLEYFNTAGENERAKETVQRSSDILKAVQGLEESKKRRAALDALPLADLSGKTAEQVVDFFTSATSIVDSSASDESLRSHASVSRALDSLTQMKTDLLKKRTDLAAKQAELAKAQTDGKPAADIAALSADLETLRSSVAALENSVFRTAEALMAAVRGEEQARRSAVLYMLGQKDSSGNAVTADALNKTFNDQEKLTDSAALDASKSAASGLYDLFSQNKKKSFADILKIVNDREAALMDHASALSDPARDRERAVLNTIRSYVLNFRSMIDYANKDPDAYDGRSQDTKWQSLISQVDALNKNAVFYSQFQAGIPSSASDSWVVNFKQERSAVLAKLTNVLSASDSQLRSRLDSLPAADRDIIARYGSLDDANLRSGLNAVVLSLRSDIAGADFNFRQLYLREQAVDASGTISRILPDLKTRQTDYDLAGDEFDRLTRDKAALVSKLSDPALSAADKQAVQSQIDDITARLGTLDTRRTDLLSQLTALQDQYRTANAVIAEAQKAGSSATLVGTVMAELKPDTVRMEMLRYTLNMISAPEAKAEDALKYTYAEQIKGILGFFETEPDGTIRRDSNGKGIVAAEFQPLTTNPDADLRTLLTADQKGADLERWASRLQDFLRDPDKAKLVPAEVRAAVQLLQTSLLDYRAAVLFIEHRDNTQAELQALASDMTNGGRTKTEKLGLVISLENDIRAAIENAQAKNQDTVEAALAVLEKPDNARVLALFAGYDASGKPDAVSDPETDKRLTELATLAERLREARLDRKLSDMALRYAQSRSANTAILAANAGVIDYTRTDFLQGYPELKGDQTVAAVGAIGDASFRADLWRWVDATASGSYRDEVINVLTLSRAEGADLKTEVMGALAALRTSVDSRVSSLLGAVETPYLRDRDVVVKDSIEGLMTAWAVKAQTSRDRMLPVIAATADGTAVDTAKATLSGKVNDLLSDPALTSVRREMLAVIDKAVDTAALKTALTAYLNGLSDPTAAETAKLKDDLYERETLKALALSESADTYKASDYPAELREIVLLRAHEKAEKRYADFLTRRSSSTAAVRDGASLDLTGLMGDMARAVLVRDFDSYVSQNPVAAFAAGGEGKRTASDYVTAYLLDRKTDVSHLPGLSAVLERLALAQFQKITADAAASGSALWKLDESAYLADFKTYLLLAKLDDFKQSTGLVLTGATPEDRLAGLRTSLDAMLDSNTYAVGGKTLRQRLLSSKDIDAFVRSAFAYLEAGGGPANPSVKNTYLPSALADRARDNKLAAPALSSDDYLPADLKLIAGWQTKDYRDTAKASNAKLLSALAKVDTLTAEPAALLTDADITSLINRAGYSSVAAPVQAELVELLRARNAALKVSGSSSAAAALQAYREHRVFETLFTSQAVQDDVKVFISAARTTIDSVESKFFTELEKSHAELRRLAKEERGAFFEALIGRITGTNAGAAYYAALSASSGPAFNGPAEFDALVAKLSASFSTEEKAHLKNNAGLYRQTFDLRSGQELVTSGIFEGAESALMTGLLRSRTGGPAPAALLDAVRANPNAALRALVKSLYVSAGVETADASSTSFVASVPGLSARLGELVAGIDPALKKALLTERVLVNRFLDLFQESDTDRAFLDRVLSDPSLTQPGGDLSVSLEAQKTAVLAQKNMSDLTSALLGTLKEHQVYASQAKDRFAMDQELGRRLNEFAALRGADVKTSRWGSYRTYVGVERGYQDADYQRYAADHPDPDPTIEQTNGGLLLTAQSLGQNDAKSLLDSGNWQTLLTSDNKSTVKTVVLDNGTVDTSDDRTVEMTAVKTVGDAQTRKDRFTVNGVLDQDAMMTSIYYESLANNYLEMLSRLNAAVSGALSAASLADAHKNDSPDFLAAVRTSYDANAAAALSTDALVKVKQDQEAKLSKYSDNEVTAKQGAVAQTRNDFDNAARDFAGAGRRNALLSMNEFQYKQQILDPAVAEFQAADKAVQDLSAIADQQRLDHAAKSRELTDAMNKMADMYRSFTAANQDYDMRRAVYDYANTPYLSAGTNDPDAGTADAENKYQQALAAYEASQKSLSDAGLRVQTQDQLSVFNDVVAGIENQKTYAVLTADERTAMYDLEARKFRPGAALTSAESLELTTLRAKDPAALTANEKTRLDTLTAAEKASKPLTADEQALLASYVERDVAERYKDVIRTRADDIKQTMRMVRIHKANEIIQAEIEKRRVAAEEKKRQFDSALDYNLPVSIPACKPAQSAADCKAMQDDVKASQLAVYQRLVQAQETGGNLGVYNEYKSWYWATGQFGQQVFNAWTGAASLSWLPPLPSFTPQQISEGAGGIALAGSMNGDDRTAVLTYLANGGQVREFNSFAPNYYAYMQTLANADAMKAMIPIAQATAFIMANAGAAMILLGSILLPTAAPFYSGGAALVSTGASMLAAAFFTFGASIGPALSMIGSGLLMIAAGVGITAASLALIAGGAAAISGGIQLVQNAVLQANIAQQFSMLTQLNTVGQSTAGSAMKVRDAEKEYQAAQADLDYFTKVKDMKTLKDHLIQYGKQHGDDLDQDGKYDALYSLTEEDLQYLSDAGGFVDSSGNTENVSTEVQTEALNVSGEYKAGDYTDSFGRYYNPDTLTASPPTLTLVSGTYRDSSGTKWTQVLSANADGSRTTMYAQLANGDGKVSSDAQKHSAYDMGRILQMLVDHADRLQADRQGKYIAAGDAVTASGGDEGFILRERDQTLQYLHDRAGGDADGGYEYSGYAATNDAYAGNASTVYMKELDQRVALQEKEWDLRQLELDTSRQEWEDKMQSILTRGQKAWSASEDKYLAQWRKWEKEYDRDTEDGKAEWDRKIKQHFSDRDAWEAKIRSSTTSANINEVMGSSIDALNTQLEAASADLKVSFDKVNRLKAIQDMIAEVRAKDPSGTDRLALVNKNIDKFSTLLGIGEIQASDHFSGMTKGGTSSLLSDFKKAMEDHKKGMKVYANAKAMEAYQKMIAQLEDQINRQNDAVEQQTEISASTQGYTKVGGVFVKNASTGGMTGVVNTYSRYDGKSALEREMGANLKSTSEIIDMLKNQSDVEVEAFFYTQRLVTQAAFERIVGKGTKEERANARDERTLGQFGMWVGREPNSQTAGQINQAAGGSFSSVHGANRDLATNALSGGFGELGSAGTRPGGSPLGFYLQLQLMGDALSQHDAEHMLELNGDFTNTFAGGSVGYQLGMAYNNARVRTEIYHESKGKVYRAESVKFTKAAAKSAAVIAASAVGGWGGFALGAAMMAAGETMNENGSFSMNSQKATSLGFGLVAVGAGAYMGGGGTGLSQGANAGINFGSGVVQSGFQWDAEGHQTGFGYKGGALEAALLTGAVSAGMGAAGEAAGLGVAEKALASQAVTGTLNSAVQFHKYKSGQHNNFEGMMKTGDVAMLGGLVGSIAGEFAAAAYKANRAQKEADEMKKVPGWDKMSPEDRMNVLREMAKDSRYADSANILAKEEAARAAQKEGQKREATNILLGASRAGRKGKDVTDGDVIEATNTASNVLRSQNKSFGDWDKINADIKANLAAGDDINTAVSRAVDKHGGDMSSINPAEYQKAAGALNKEVADKLAAQASAAKAASNPARTTPGLMDYVSDWLLRSGNLEASPLRGTAGTPPSKPPFSEWAGGQMKDYLSAVAEAHVDMWNSDAVRPLRSALGSLYKGEGAVLTAVGDSLWDWTSAGELIKSGQQKVDGLFTSMKGGITDLVADAINTNRALGVAAEVVGRVPLVLLGGAQMVPDMLLGLAGLVANPGAPFKGAGTMLNGLGTALQSDLNFDRMKAVGGNVSGIVGNYVSGLFGFDEASWRNRASLYSTTGRIAAEVASLFVGVGEAKLAANAAKTGDLFGFGRMFENVFELTADVRRSEALLADTQKGMRAVDALAAAEKGVGFETFAALKRYLGPNKPGSVYHHLVEQHGDNLAKFGNRSVQNTANVIELPHGPETIHNRISAFYSSKRPFTNGLTVREWLKPQSFEEQFEFGVDTVRRFGGDGYLPGHLQ